MSRRPGRSLANDTVFNCAQAAAFVVVFTDHVHSEVAVITAWGLGGLAGALYGLRQYRVQPTLHGGWSLLCERWSVSKWIAGSSVLSWAAAQMYVFITGAILGPAGLGGLKAAQTLVGGPSGVLIQAGGSIGLPEATRAYADKGWKGLVHVTRVVTVAGFVSLLAGLGVVAVWGRVLLSHIYGPAFGRLETTSVLFGVAYVVIGFFLGPVLVLKATRRTRWLMHVQILGLIVSAVSMAVFCAELGVVGAADATIVTNVAYALAYRWCQRAARVAVGDAGAPPSGGPLPDGTVRVSALDPSLLADGPLQPYGDVAPSKRKHASRGATTRSSN